MIDSRAAANSMAIAAIALWMWSGVCFRRGAETMGIMPYLTLMTATGVLTVAVAQAWSRRPLGDLVRLPARVVVAGFFGVALYTIIVSAAVAMAERRDVGQVALMNYLWPIWMVLFSIALLDDRPRALPALAGVGLGFLGVALSSGPEAWSRPPAALGPHAMALGAGALWALYPVLLRRWRIPAELDGTALHFAVCAAMAAAIATARGEWGGVARAPAEGWLWVLFGGVGPVGLAYRWWEVGAKRGSSALLATLAYFIPVGSTALMCVFFRETLSPWLLAAAALIAIGAGLTRAASRR